MRKILPNNLKTKHYLDTLTKIYIIALWAKWGVREYHFSGKFREMYNKHTDKTEYMPLVWHYDDHNGTADQWELIPLAYVTTGEIRGWTFSRSVAEAACNRLNFLLGRDRQRHHHGYVEDEMGKD